MKLYGLTWLIICEQNALCSCPSLFSAMAIPQACADNGDAVVSHHMEGGCHGELSRYTVDSTVSDICLCGFLATEFWGLLVTAIYLG